MRTSTYGRSQNTSGVIPAGAHNVPLLHYDAQTGQQTPNPEFLAVMQANFCRRRKVAHRLSGRGAVHPRSAAVDLARVSACRQRTR